MNRFVSAILAFICLLSCVPAWAVPAAQVPSSPYGVAQQQLVRIRANARAAQACNPRTLGVMATPPTITDMASIPVGYGTNKSFVSNPTSFHVVGAIPVSVGGYYRFPAANGGSGWAGNISSTGYQATAARISFMCDDVTCIVRVGRSAAPYRFLVTNANGCDQYVSLTGTLTSAASPGTTSEYMVIDFTSAGGRAINKITVETQQDNSIVAVYPGSVAGRIFAPPPPANVIHATYLIDSYGGTAPTYLGDAFAFRIGDAMGWEMQSSSMPGTGWIATGSNELTYGQRIANGDLGMVWTPDVILTDGSVNDRQYAAAQQATIQANETAGILAALAKYPNAIIFVFGCVDAPNTYKGTPTQQVEAAGAAAVAAINNPRVIFLPMTSDPEGAVITGTGFQGTATGNGNGDYYMYSDGIHPNDAGHIYLGGVETNKILQAIGPLN